KRIAQVSVDCASRAHEAGPDQFEPPFEVSGGGLGTDGVGVRGVTDEIEHEQPAITGMDLNRSGARVRGLLGRLLAAKGQLGIAELDLVAIAERDALLEAETVVIGAVGAA